MNEKLPYEKELLKQLNDLPLPDEADSWEDMKRRLDEDNDDGIIIPPVKKGCMGYGLLLLLLALILFIVVRPDKLLRPKKEKSNISKEILKKENDKSNRKDSGKKLNRYESLVQEKKFDSPFDDKKKDSIISDSLNENNKVNNQNNFAKENIVLNNHSEKNNVQINKARNSKIKNITPVRLKSNILNNDQEADSSVTNEEIITNENDSLDTTGNNTSDSTSTKAEDSTNVKEKIRNIDSTLKSIKEDSVIRHPVYFAIGLALYQQLPIDGQKLTPYNSLGRKSSLGDYIPSLYFRIYRDKKWFIQSEFRYGAPQYTKEILYNQKKILDTFTNTTLSTSNRVKKTFYHQLPVSFNYFALPHFSIGAGFTWNKFSSAVIEQEVKETNNVTMTDSNQVITILHSKKPDSNFVKSYFQALIETQYEWNRFSFGARYSFGLQPYIKFQLRGGEQREEKNNALQIFVRYNLWESKKK